jgi:hypothetical protein
VEIPHYLEAVIFADFPALAGMKPDYRQRTTNLEKSPAKILLRHRDDTIKAMWITSSGHISIRVEPQLDSLGQY